MNSMIDARAKSIELAIDFIDRLRERMQLPTPVTTEVVLAVAARFENRMTENISVPGVNNTAASQVIINNVKAPEPVRDDDDDYDSYHYSGYMAVYRDGDRLWGSEVYDTREEAEENAARYAGYVGVISVSI